MANPLLWADISSNNLPPDLRAYKAAGHRDLMVKVSEGNGYLWTDGRTIADQAHALGLNVGHYHWLRPDSDPISQANFYLAHVDGHTAAGDWLMTDFELTAGAPDPSDSTRAWQLRTFNAKVRAARPDLPLVIYTGNWYLEGKPACQSACRAFPVVMSYYNSGPVPNPYGLSYAAQQFTSQATVPGFTAPVDYNRWLHRPGGSNPQPTDPGKDQLDMATLSDVTQAVQSGLQGQQLQTFQYRLVANRDTGSPCSLPPPASSPRSRKTSSTPWWAASSPAPPLGSTCKRRST
jgi:GH25 family lysozyme M1 (1,4-beta-N-acetylmuramidase)